MKEKEGSLIILIETLLLVVACVCIFSLMDANEYLTQELDIYKSAYQNVTEQVPKKESIYEIAEEVYGIEKELLIAIEKHETKKYQSRLYIEQNNTWGSHDGNEYRTYRNDDESTLDLARCLRVYYYNNGLNTLEEIATEFCQNDIDGWVAKVKYFYNDLKGV